MHVFKVTCFALLAMTVHATLGRHHDDDAHLSRRQNDVPPDLPEQNEGGAPEPPSRQAQRRAYPVDFWKDSRYRTKPGEVEYPHDPEYPFEDPIEKCPPKARSKILLCRNFMYGWRFPATIEVRRTPVEQLHWEKAREIAAECRKRHGLTEEYWDVFLKKVPEHPGTGEKKDATKIVPQEEDESSKRTDENVKGFWNQAVQSGQKITKKLIPLATPPQNMDKSSRGFGGDGFFPVAGRLPVPIFP